MEPANAAKLQSPVEAQPPPHESAYQPWTTQASGFTTNAKMAMEINITPLKEPRGFLRVLQLIFAIFAFATTSGFSNTINYDMNCPNNTTFHYSYSYSYPFRINAIEVKSCSSSSTMTGDFSSQSQYFVASGVLAFLYCILSLILYVCYDKLYRSNMMVPMVDFGLTVILAVFWLTSAAAWSQGVADLKYFASARRFKPCPEQHTCWNYLVSSSTGSFASLNVSLIFGYLNFGLWAANLWFLFKETPWFLSRTGKPADTQ